MGLIECESVNVETDLGCCLLVSEAQSAIEDLSALEVDLRLSVVITLLKGVDFGHRTVLFKVLGNVNAVFERVKGTQYKV